MIRQAYPSVRRDPALDLLRELRRLDEASGVRHSGIARDIGLLLYERGSGGLSVHELTARTGFSGPTIRLVIGRLVEAGTVTPGDRLQKTQLYLLTGRGTAAFDSYVAAIWAFAERFADDAAPLSAGARTMPGPDRPAGRRLFPARYAAAPPAPEGAD